MTGPSRSVAEIIAGCWRELLGTEVVSSGDDFILLGGTSSSGKIQKFVQDQLRGEAPPALR